MKRLNNRGWGEKDMILYCGIIDCVLLVIYILLNQFQHMMDIPSNDSSRTSIEQEVNGDTVPGVITHKTEEESTQTVVDENYYLTLEDSLRIAARAYVEQQYEEMSDDTTMHITLEQLTSLGFLDQVKDSDGNICSGYVTYTSSDEQYKPYLNCEHYTTNGYETQYE